MRLPDPLAGIDPCPSRLACESPPGHEQPRARKSGAGIGQPRLSALGCQLWLAGSSVEGAGCAAGRSLQGMSLAFALMAAIKGSTGSCATLSHGLERPHQASPASARRRQGFSLLMGGGARGRPGGCRAKSRESHCSVTVGGDGPAAPHPGPVSQSGRVLAITNMRHPANQLMHRLWTGLCDSLHAERHS